MSSHQKPKTTKGTRKESLPKIVTIIGTRPQTIKVDRELNQTLIWTGQHYDYNMSQKFFKELKLQQPDYNLGTTDFGQMTDKVRLLLRNLKPELVLVYGDCTSTLAGALAAAYENIPVAHVEAGLRCGRMDMPEEINRVLTDRISTYKFCTSEDAALNLYREGIRSNVYMVGDVMFDAMNPFCPLKKKDFRKYILLTVHRAENTTKERLSKIMEAMNSISESIIFPVHPRTKKMLKEYDIKVPRNVKTIRPVGYKEMLSLESNAKHIITDSGGVTREAYWMQIPCTSLRKETEFPEMVSTGWLTLADVDKDKILSSIINFNRSNKDQPNFQFGAKTKIREILSKYQA